MCVEFSRATKFLFTDGAGVRRGNFFFTRVVNRHVGLQIVLLRESLVTLGTNERFLAGVRAIVSFQVRNLSELSGTPIATEWFLSGVGAQVRLESAVLGETFIANGAAERTLLRIVGIFVVTSHVLFQIILLGECLSAIFTGEWPLTGMFPHMRDQVIFLSKLPTAGGTIERSLTGMNSDVSLEVRRLLELHRAMRAFENLCFVFAFLGMILVDV